MKYMIMIYNDEAAETQLTPAEVKAKVSQHAAASEALGEAAEHIGARLHFSEAATTLRKRGGEWFAVDGPFAESKEVLGGFHQIEADSLDAAVAWARQLPLSDTDAIEVRPARTGATGSGAVRGKDRYTVLFVADREAQPSRGEFFAAIDRHYELSLDLAVQGKFVASRSLGDPSESRTLRRRDGETVVTDGPFAETKEFVAGYFVIACDTPEEAREWAQQLTVGGACCELRPVRGM